MADSRDLPEKASSETDGLTEDEFRKAVRSKFSEVEIDLILELISRVPVAVWAASGKQHDFAVQLWSPGAEKLYGFSKQDVFGKNYIEKFVNRLERRQAILDHETLEDTRLPYRNLARDQRSDKTSRLMLTQGIALWHPVLRHYLQGEITVDATDVPGKDRSWLEQVLTPESVRSLLEHFTKMTQAAFESLESVIEIAGALIKVFLGESAECLVLVDRPGAHLLVVGRNAPASLCEFDPKAVVRWCMSTEKITLVVDYNDSHPPARTRSPHVARFPERVQKISKKSPFAVGLVQDEDNRSRGGIFIYLAPGETFSQLTDGVLAAVCGTIKLALAIEEKIAQTKREGSLAAAERERQATTRLARQYRHAVLKKAQLLELLAGLLRENINNQERITQTADALSSMSKNLAETGKSFETNLTPEQFNLTDVLSSVTGGIIQAYPNIKLSRDTFPQMTMHGIRPFIEGAIENLLLNAVEAQGLAGEIGVICEIIRGGRSQRYLDLLICDNGPGLPIEVREKIRVGQQITTKGEGHGLGLVIARLSLDECGGAIEPLTDPIRGWRGACFRVRLPLATFKAKKR